MYVYVYVCVYVCVCVWVLCVGVVCCVCVHVCLCASAHRSLSFANHNYAADAYGASVPDSAHVRTREAVYSP